MLVITFYKWKDRIMRIALVSDIHGNLAALETVAADIRHRGVDKVVNLGDSVSGSLWPQETAQYLMASGWLHLAGNHERQLLTLPPEQQGLSDRFAHTQLGMTELAWLAGLPSVLHLDNDVLLCHGTPHSDHIYLLETILNGSTILASPDMIEQRLQGTRAAVIACGHTHIARSIRLKGMLLLNPGSVGLPAYADDCPPHTVETGSPDARYAIIEYRNGSWQAKHYNIAYPYRYAASLAEQRQRPDWAAALRYGRVSLPSNAEPNQHYPV